MAVVDGRVVDMGRLVGAGVKYCRVQDLAVLPQHQRVGLGQALLDRLLGHVRRTAPTNAFVGLLSTQTAEVLYRDRTFARGALTGMYRLGEPSRP